MSDSFVLGAFAGCEGMLPAPAIVPEVQGAKVQKETTESIAAERKKNEVFKEIYVVKDGQTLWESAQISG